MLVEPFIKLTSTLTNPSIEINDKLTFICQFTSQIIEGADRVSLWRFDHAKTKITCVMCFDALKGEFSAGQEIMKSHFGPYFEEIIKYDVINAPDARNHPATACFTQDYFTPLNIYSLLDYILHKDFSPVGVICCESVEKQTKWLKSDEEMLERIARASSMYFNIDAN
ncbi:GAF domain-containing protein [Thalassotalea sp. PLHSN55]|uniref:GAF domain-containing protein n=1 Tax=Thalassotalea sp. PLHSN55 TaxID=3435888 RepID=UPI003F861479